MDFKEFFKPRVAKVIAPLIWIFWSFLYGLSAPTFCGTNCPGFWENLVNLFTTVQFWVMLIIVTLVLYFVSCSIYQMVKKKTFR